MEQSRQLPPLPNDLPQFKGANKNEEDYLKKWAEKNLNPEQENEED